MLGGYIADNILCLLSYNEQYASIIRNSVPLNLYPGPHRIISSRIYDYLDRFHKPPGDHLPDLLEDKLSAETAESSLYKNLILSIRNTQEGLNTEYVIKTLELFIKRQSLRTIAVDLTKALQRDTEESLEEADRLISQSRHSQLQLFDPGTRLSDKNKALSFLDFSNECFPTGIKELDKRGFGPTRKELWLGIGDKKSGKSFLLTHLAKMAIMNRLKVVHITLEMSEGRCAQRYFQTLYSIAKRTDIGTTIKFKKDDQGRILSFDEVKITPKHTLQDLDIREKLEKIINKWALRQLNNIYIKEFPTGSLTLHQLDAYLDNLEATQRFTPDLLIMDYPDLMELDKDNFRLGLDSLYKGLRGIAVKRNIAIAAVSQSNRGGAKAKTVKGTDIAESYSKMQHADTAITISSTDAEKRLGLARLYVAAARNDEGNLILVISQHYKTGSFIIDAAVMSNEYWDKLPVDENEE
jgi:replicative DNA helicase